MKKIEKIDYASNYEIADLCGKLNEVVHAVNGLKCIENEEPIYETLNHNDVLIISKSDEGVLVASNRLGEVKLERVKYPKEEVKE